MENLAITEPTPKASWRRMRGLYNGSPHPATALVAGVNPGVDNMPASSHEGVTPTITYNQGTTTTGTPLAGAPSAIGTYTVVANFAGASRLHQCDEPPRLHSRSSAPVYQFLGQFSQRRLGHGQQLVARTRSNRRRRCSNHFAGQLHCHAFGRDHRFGPQHHIRCSDHFSGGILQVATNINLNGGSLTLSGGDSVWRDSQWFQRAELVTTAQGGTLDGVTIGANSTLDSSKGVAMVLNGLTLNGTALLGYTSDIGGYDLYMPGGLFFQGSQTLSGSGAVSSNITADPGDGGICGVFAVDNGGPATLTIGSGITVQGGDLNVGWGTYQVLSLSGLSNAIAGSTDAMVISRATITTSTGKTIALDNVTNDGAVRTNGGMVSFGGSDNGGTIAIGVSGTLDLGGTFSTLGLGLGTVQNTGGTVQLTGTLNNTGATLALTAATGSWDLWGGTIQGGTITGTGGSALVLTAAGGTLSGVTIGAGAPVNGGAGNTKVIFQVDVAVLTIVGSLTLNGTLDVGPANGYGSLTFSGTQTLGGTGQMV